eukprot:386442-Prymnesium_polylepis.1
MVFKIGQQATLRFYTFGLRPPCSLSAAITATATFIERPRRARTHVRGKLTKVAPPAPPTTWRRFACATFLLVREKVNMRTDPAETPSNLGRVV